MKRFPHASERVLTAGQPDERRSLTRFLALAMLLVPVLLLLTALTDIAVGDTTAEELEAITRMRTRFTISTLSFTLAFLLLIPVAVGAVMLVRRGRGSGVTRAGAVMVAVGAATFACVQYGYLTTARIVTGGEVDPASALDVLEAGETDPVVVAAWLVGMLTFLGLILIGIGLARAGAVPLWHAALLIAGPLLLFLAPEQPVVQVLMWLPLISGIGLLAPHLLRD